MDYLTNDSRGGLSYWFQLQCKGSGDNMRLGKQHPKVMRDYVLMESEPGRLLGLFDPQVFPESADIWHPQGKTGQLEANPGLVITRRGERA